jgi:hypothetical protein
VIKVTIFVVVALLLFVIARRLSAGEPSYVPEPPPPPEPDGLPEPDFPQNKISRAPAAVGSDLPFPIPLPPITRSPDGLYNRPRILNYYFSNIDLIRGPADPRSFSDEFHLELQSPADSQTWTDTYMVVTPDGLQKELDSLGPSALYLNSSTIVVSKWDLAAVLEAIMKHIMGDWAHPDTDEA